ncbi:MAG: hypothetical protein ABSF48_08730 [Thermodesulfobacteriota bacterium]|jgi:hypothetical protein
MLPVDLMGYPSLGLVRLMVKNVVGVAPVDGTKGFCLRLEQIHIKDAEEI